METTAAELLKALVRADTSDPPGNELAALDILAEVLAGAGVAAAVQPTAPGREMCIRDRCGRGTLGWALELPTEKIGAFDAELVREFFLAFTRTAACALHVRGLAGENSHHLAECAFKAFARALRAAAAIDPAAAGEIPSTKGTLL